MKYIKNKIMHITIGLSVILLNIGFVFAYDNAKPDIKTENTQAYSSVYITLPKDFSGKVYTSCVNGVCKSTSSPLSENEIKELQIKINNERNRIKEFFEMQNKLFDEYFSRLNAFDIFRGMNL